MASFILVSIGTVGSWGVAGEDTDPSPDDGAIARDVVALSVGLGLPPEEVSRQLKLQEKLDEIDLDDNIGYAGVTNRLGSEFIVDYYSTTELSAAEWDEFAAVGLSAYVHEVRVDHDLKSMEASLHRLRATAGLPAVDIRVDVEANELRVASESWPSEEVRSRAERAAGMPVQWATVEGLLQPALGGGRNMSNGCTGGFVVVKTTTGNRGLSSAAHCSNSTTYDSKVLTHMNEWQSGSYDLEWWDNSTITWENKIKDGVGDGRVINAVMADANINIGDAICKYGDSTGYDCGEVTDVIICPNYVTNCNATFIEYDSTDSPKHDMTEPGDSGGPVFFGNTAWGIISGGESGGGTRGIFMPADFFTDKELRVATN